MYLNIINSINIENNRKRNNFSDNNEKEVKKDNEYEESIISENINLKSYYSIFYGELTNNWILLKS